MIEPRRRTGQRRQDDRDSDPWRVADDEAWARIVGPIPEPEWPEEPETEETERPD